jgi:phenylacetate-CoA ligase
VFSAYSSIKKSCALKSDELNKLAIRNLEQLLIYSYKYVPYYRKVFDDAGFDPNKFNIDDFKTLPVLTKNIIRNNGDSLTSTEVKKKIMMKTGGSTGEPLRVYKDIDCRAQDIATQYLAMEFSGYRFIEDRFAFFIGGSLGLDKERNISRKLGDFIFNRVTLPAFGLNKDNIDYYYNIIVKRKCRYIFAYSSILYHFAHCLSQSNLHFSKGDLKGVFSTAEMLYPERREFIESILKCKVFDFYGSVEVNCIASQCRQQNYHILSDAVYLETDNDNNLLITDLKNYAQPIIRYKNGDRILMEDMDKRCECGLPYPLLKKVLGRTGDLIYKINREPISNSFFPHLFAKLKSFDSFQIVQNNYDSLYINLVKSALFDASEEKVLISKLKEYLGENMDIAINYVEKIPLTKSGKLRITISHIPFNDNMTDRNKA